MTDANADRTDASTTTRVETGIPGVDRVLEGGLMPGRSTLVRGPPGAGKTLFCLHFLMAGVENDETGLFINFEESERHVRKNVADFGFDLDAIEFLDLAPTEEAFTDEATYEIFSTAEVEGSSLATEITETIEEVAPDRTVIDPVTQLRYVAGDTHQFRKQMIALLRLLRNQGAATVFTSQRTDATPDDDLQFLSDAVIHLDQTETRTLRVSKFRGSDFQRGEHSLRITDDGLTCAPRLVPDDHERKFTAESISSGVPELDALLYGGIERGTVTFLSGPTGVGKTTTGLQFMKEAAGRGERSVLYSFEEGTETLLHRAEAINVPIENMIEQGTLRIEEIQPFEFTPHEFAQRVRRTVEKEDTEIVMIDGICGYQQSIRGISDDDIEEIVALGRYLKNVGVTTIVVNETHQVTGEFQVTEGRTSYLADTIVFLCHIEHRGELRKVIGVLKKRTSDFERRLRELEITEHGLKVGDPLPDLRGILTGTPEWIDRPESNR